jgi:hypothetical protein
VPSPLEPVPGAAQPNTKVRKSLDTTIHKLTDLFDLDLRKLVTHNLKWFYVDDSHGIETTRRMVNAERQQFMKTRQNNRNMHKVMDKYRASIPTRVTALLKRINMDTAQRLKDVHSHRKLKCIPVPFDTQMNTPMRFIWDGDDTIEDRFMIRLKTGS